MYSNLRPKEDPHQISLDLDGLDEFLESMPEIVETESAIDVTVTGTEPAPEQANTEDQGERQLMLQLLEQVAWINSSVDAARDRLAAANERMSSLTTVVQLQTGQFEMLAHYQSQAARVVTLERQVLLLTEENDKLKRPWWKKLFGR